MIVNKRPDDTFPIHLAVNKNNVVIFVNFFFPFPYSFSDQSFPHTTIIAHNITVFTSF